MVGSLVKNRQAISDILSKLDFGDSSRKRLSKFRSPLNRIDRPVVVAKPFFQEVEVSTCVC